MNTTLVSFLKFCLPLCVFLVFSEQIYSQRYGYPQANTNTGRWLYGGNIGLSFGNNFFSATLAPSALYQFTPKVAAGAGLNFSYASSNDFYKATIWGGSLIGLFNPAPAIQLSAEFDQLRVQRNYEGDLFRDEDYWYPALFLGAGYTTGPVTVGIRYDALYDGDKSIYANAWIPFVRVYF